MEGALNFEKLRKGKGKGKGVGRGRGTGRGTNGNCDKGKGALAAGLVRGCLAAPIVGQAAYPLSGEVPT